MLSWIESNETKQNKTFINTPWFVDKWTNSLIKLELSTFKARAWKAWALKVGSRKKGKAHAYQSLCLNAEIFIHDVSLSSGQTKL